MSSYSTKNLCRISFLFILIRRSQGYWLNWMLGETIYLSWNQFWRLTSNLNIINWPFLKLINGKNILNFIIIHWFSKKIPSLSFRAQTDDRSLRGLKIIFHFLASHWNQEEPIQTKIEFAFSLHTSDSQGNPDQSVYIVRNL